MEDGIFLVFVFRDIRVLYESINYRARRCRAMMSDQLRAENMAIAMVMVVAIHGLR